MSLPAICRAKLVLTERCQLDCTYCYEHSGTKDMSLELAKSCIDLMYKNAKESNKIPEISFFGGEPLLVYEELMKPCIDYIRKDLKSRHYIGFTTNGILLDEEKLQYFRENDVHFMLSIDGNERSHDSCRVYKDGKGSFKDIESKIPLILTYFPITRARITLTPDNVEYLAESIEYLENQGFLDIHVVPDLSVLVTRNWSPSDFDIAKEQLSIIESHAIEKFENTDLPILFKSLEDMFPRIVLNQYSEKVDHYRSADCCIPEYRCGIGALSNVIIDVEGNVFACQHGPVDPTEENPLYLGNISEGISEERRIQLIEMNRENFKCNTIDCNTCPLDRICTGGCVPNNYSSMSSFTIVPEAYCLWTQLLYETAYNIASYFDKDKKNLLFKDYFYGVVKRGVICVC